MAGATVSIDVEGITHELGEALEKSVIFDVATQILEELKKKDEFFYDQTGTMRASFEMRRYAGGLAYLIQSKNPHAWYLEKGHMLINHGKDTDKHVKGRYFMRKAKNRIKSRLQDILDSYDIVITGGRGVHIRKKGRR